MHEEQRPNLSDVKEDVLGSRNLAAYGQWQSKLPK